MSVAADDVDSDVVEKGPRLNFEQLQYVHAVGKALRLDNAQKLKDFETATEQYNRDMEAEQEKKDKAAKKRNIEMRRINVKHVDIGIDEGKSSYSAPVEYKSKSERQICRDTVDVIKEKYDSAVAAGDNEAAEKLSYAQTLKPENVWNIVFKKCTPKQGQAAPGKKKSLTDDDARKIMETIS